MPLPMEQHVLTMQDALARLDEYWTGRGCLKVQPMNTEVGAGTLNPATFLRVLGPEPWRVAYVEPSVRPDDSRYGENPNRIQCHTQYTYFQQAGGVNLDPVAVELTYGVERILMALQGVRHFKDIAYADGVTYGEVFGQAEYEMSRYYLDDADVAANRTLLELYTAEAQRMIDERLPVPAYSYVLKCSQTFNVLDARGAVSTAERAAAFARMRRLAAGVAQLWMQRRAELGHPLGVVATPEPAQAAGLPVEANDGPRRFVLEVGTEEMAPAEAASAREQLDRLVTDALAGTRLTHGPVAVYATPRRLVAVVEAVAGREEDHTRLVRGPKVAAAFDAAGAPTAAAAGFARANGVAVEELERVDVGGTEHLALRRHEPGRSAVVALTEALGGTVAALRSAKNMRWSDPQLAFTRPIRWLLALWGDQVVPLRVSTLAAGRTTWVLRTADHPAVTVDSAEALLDQLAAAGIVLDQARRWAGLTPATWTCPKPYSPPSCASTSGTCRCATPPELCNRASSRSPTAPSTWRRSAPATRRSCAPATRTPRSSTAPTSTYPRPPCATAWPSSPSPTSSARCSNAPTGSPTSPARSPRSASPRRTTGGSSTARGAWSSSTSARRWSPS